MEQHIVQEIRDGGDETIDIDALLQEYEQGRIE